MAKKATLVNITAGHTSQTQINTNFDAVNDQFDNTISRDGSTPNDMQADFDVGGNKIINAADPTAALDLVTKQYGDANYGGSAAAAAEAAQVAAELAETNAQTAETNAETAETNAGVSETNAAADAALAQAAVGGVRVSADDTTADNLETKLLVGNGLSLSTQNPAGNETRTIDTDPASQAEVEALTDNDKPVTPLGLSHYEDKYAEWIKITNFSLSSSTNTLTLTGFDLYKIVFNTQDEMGLRVGATTVVTGSTYAAMTQLSESHATSGAPTETSSSGYTFSSMYIGYDGAAVADKRGEVILSRLGEAVNTVAEFTGSAVQSATRVSRFTGACSLNAATAHDTVQVAGLDGNNTTGTFAVFGMNLGA